MKDLKSLNVEISFSSPLDAYNQMRTKSTSTPQEAKRTLEALEKVRVNPTLIRLVKEES